MKFITTSRAFQAYQVSRYTALVFVGIILAKTGFTTSDIGVFETLILASGITSFFWLNGMLNTYVVKSQQGYENPLNALLKTVAIFTAIICILLTILQQPFLKFFSIQNDFLFYLLPFIILNNFSFVTEHILLVNEKRLSLLALAIAHLLLVPTFVIIASLYFSSIEAVILGLILFLFLKNVYLIFLILRNKGSHSPWKAFFQSGIPLSLSYLFGGISVYADGVIVNNFYSKSDFAVYQYGAREFPLAMLLANAFSIVMVKHLSKNLKEGLNEVRSGSTRLWHQLFPLGILLMVISPWLFPLIFNEQFEASYVFFNIYLLLLIPRLVFPQSIIIAKGWTQFQMRISMIEFLINIVFSLILMSYVGLAGIALGTVIAYSFEKVALVIFMKRNGIRLKDYTNVKLLLGYSVILIIVFLFTTIPGIQ